MKSGQSLRLVLVKLPPLGKGHVSEAAWSKLHLWNAQSGNAMGSFAGSAPQDARRGCQRGGSPISPAERADQVEIFVL